MIVYEVRIKTLGLPIPASTEVVWVSAETEPQAHHFFRFLSEFISSSKAVGFKSTDPEIDIDPVGIDSNYVEYNLPEDYQNLKAHLLNNFSLIEDIQKLWKELT